MHKCYEILTVSLLRWLYNGRFDYENETADTGVVKMPVGVSKKI
jgi:hypothetical protein